MHKTVDLEEIMKVWDYSIPSDHCNGVQ